MIVTLIFYNGDSCEEAVTDVVPPGRLYWVADAEATNWVGGAFNGDDRAERLCDRVFWLDVTTWAREQRAEYREVAKRPQ